MSAKRLDNLRSIDPVLTTLVQLHKNDLFLSKELFHTVKVKKSKGNIPIFGKDAFVARSTDRAIRADSNRIPATDFILTPYETQEQDLEMAIDYLESSQSNSYSKYEQIITKQLWDSLSLNREIEICNYLQNPDNFNLNNLTQISDSDSINNPTSTINIIELINSTKESIRLKTGRIPNTVILNNSVLEAIINSETITELIYNHKLIKPNLNMIKDYLQIENIIVSTAVYSQDNINLRNIWENNILMTYRSVGNEKENKYNPQLGYIFQLENMPEVDTYYENGGKIKIIRCTDNFCWKVTMPEAAHLITNVVS